MHIKYHPWLQMVESHIAELSAMVAVVDEKLTMVSNIWEQLALIASSEFSPELANLRMILNGKKIHSHDDIMHQTVKTAPW